MYKRYQESIKQAASNWVESRWYYCFLALISFVFVLLFSRATSPFYAYVGYDAAIFKQMGMAILKGKTIYLDYFDNKGCLLYFLHALCLWLGGDFVILIFQAISLTVSLILLDKIILFYKEGKSRFYILLAGLVLLLCFYEGGDLTEEWSLPFICYPLYKFLKSYKDGKNLIAKDLYFIGLCFGVIAFLRINNAVPFCGFLLCLFVGYLLKKQWKELIINALAFCSGILTIAIPCFLYFYLKAGAEGVYWMVYSTFLSGFEYLGINIKVPVIVCVSYYLVVAAFLIAQFLSLKNENRLLIPIVISYLLFLLGFGTKCIEHYQVVMVPLYVISIATFKTKKNWLYKISLSLLAVILLAFLVRPFGFLFYEVILNDDKFEHVYSDFHEKIKDIPATERDSIYNYNLYLCGHDLLCHEKLFQCNRISLSPFSFGMGSLQEKRASLQEESPLWIMICHDVVIPAEMPYIQENYEESFVLHYDTKYLKNLQGFGIEKDIYFFRKK